MSTKSTAAAVETEQPDGSPAGSQGELTHAIAFVTANLPSELAALVSDRPWSYNGAPGDKQQEALAALSALVKLRTAVDEALVMYVRAARKNTGSEWYPNSASWELIGNRLGVTKQSAQAKYGKQI